MSKSVGNVINPLELIDKYGTDALRLSLVANNPAGNDLNFSETKADYYSRFITKLRNASRYVWINAIGEENSAASEIKIDLDTLREYIKDNQKSLNDFDVWILNGLDELIILLDKQFVAYNFTQAIDDVVKFTWNNFCDWYIEIAKIQRHEFTDKIMLYVVGSVLKLLHPVAPFVTEALYHDM
jgi:valyl-tRNA synthetase